MRIWVNEGDAVLLRNTVYSYVLTIATGYNNSTLSCSEFNEKHVGKVITAQVVLLLRACKYERKSFLRKFDI